MRSAGLLLCVTLGLLTTACGNTGNMFSGSGPERPFDDRLGPDTRDLLKNRPKGLLPDTTNVEHTGIELLPR